MAPTRRSNYSNGANPIIAAIIAQQLQNIIPQILHKKGGAIVLTRWIEKMESVIDNSGCAENQKVKYAASSFINKALTWWNTQIQARGNEATIGMTWEEFKELLVEEYYPSNEIEKLKNDFWNRTMVGANHAAYTDRFHELAKLVPHLVTPESKRIRSVKKEVGDGHGEQASKGVWEMKKAKVGKGFIVVAHPRNKYVSFYPKCAKCFAYHPDDGPFRLCNNCRKPSYFARDCQVPVKQAVPVNAVKVKYDQGTCYECGRPDYFCNTCPKLNRAPGQVENRLTIEVVDGKKVEVDRIIRGCKLELGNSMFTIDLIPLGYGSFDLIVRMDWMFEHKAVIVCHEKVVRIPLASGKILRVQGERALESLNSLMNTKLDEQQLDDNPVV
ncbi:reverse transcriptase domain-containing protein [Tanacetum coccineum]